MEEGSDAKEDKFTCPNCQAPLKKINIEDAARADEVFTMLMGSQVPPRKRFIQTHAKLATLDV